MKDLIEDIIKFIPAYLLSLGHLLSRPKTFLAGTAPETEVGFRNGLRFLLVSVFLAMVAISPLSKKKLDGEDFWEGLAVLSVYDLLSLAVCVGILCLAWRIVGGRAKMRSMFTMSAYSFSVPILSLALTILLIEGTGMTLDPLHYGVDKYTPSLSDPTGIVELLILISWVAAIGAWAFTAWGAFRVLNGTSRVRSFVAMLLTGVMIVPAMRALHVIKAAMSR